MSLFGSPSDPSPVLFFGQFVANCDCRHSNLNCEEEKERGGGRLKGRTGVRNGEVERNRE